MLDIFKFPLELHFGRLLRSSASKSHALGLLLVPFPAWAICNAATTAPTLVGSRLHSVEVVGVSRTLTTCLISGIRGVPELRKSWERVCENVVEEAMRGNSGEDISRRGVSTGFGLPASFTLGKTPATT